MKSGFTLIEVLAVIIILGVIIAITIPTVGKVMENRKKDSFFLSAKSIAREVEYNNVSSSTFTYASLASLNLTNISAEDYDLDNSYIFVENGVYKTNLVGSGKFAGLYACGVTANSKKNEITNQECTNFYVYTDYIDSKGVNAPRLFSGMTAVKWNGSSWDTVENPDTDTSWYDYPNKMWANAMTADGSMWVWIPRYIYKISANWHTATAGTVNIQFSKGINDNWNQSIIGNISTDSTSNASSNKWTNQPAFTFGNTELTGFWVAKFEATASEGINPGFDDTTSKTVKIIPDVQTWRNIQIGNMFTVCRNMETNNIYGWGANGIGIDTHLIKNGEWGAVTYLSKSIYGQDTNEIWKNNSQTYTAGCAGNSVSEGAYNGCENTYDTTNGVKASTTGTIYGVYDMSGGADDRTASYLDNNSGSLTTYGSSILNANSKYYDIYQVGSPDTSANNYLLSINHKGDAIYETSLSTGTFTWFNDWSYFPTGDNPWIARGWNYDYDSTAGIFSIIYNSGCAAGNEGFRPTLLVSNGL